MILMIPDFSASWFAFLSSPFLDEFYNDSEESLEYVVFEKS